MPLVSSLLFEASLSSPLPSNPCNMRTEDGGLEPRHTTQTHGVIQDRTKSLTGDFIQPIFLSTFSSPAFLINFLCLKHLSQFPSYESFRGQESFPFKPISLFLPNTSLCTISHSVVPPISLVDIIVWLPNLCNPMDCSPAPTGSSVHGISQARKMEQVAISYSQIFPTQDRTHVSCFGRRILYH